MKTFKYGLLPPTLNSKLIDDEIYKGHKYLNALIEIEIQKRNKIRTLEKNLGSIFELEKIFGEKEESYNKIIKEIKSANQKARKKVLNQELNEQKKFAYDEFKKAKLNLLDERLKIKKYKDTEEYKKSKLEIDEWCKEEESKLILDKSKCPWTGTYLLKYNTFGKIKKMPYYNGIEPNNPKFRRFDGSGIIGNGQSEIQGLISEIVNHNSIHKHIQIIPLPPQPKNNSKERKLSHNPNKFKLLRLRIGTEKLKIDGKLVQNPIWAEFPMIYDRPMSGEIRKVQVNKTKIGPRFIWTVSIVCKDVEPKQILTNSNNSVGIDLGWRKHDDRVVIGTYFGSDGKEGEICLEEKKENKKHSLLNRLKYIGDLKSVRDKEFDKIKLELSNWLKDNKSILPEWLIQETETIDRWRSQARLVKLINKWKEDRFNGDNNIIGISGKWDKQNKEVVRGTGLLGWKYHNHHLYDIEMSSSKKARNALVEFYRKTAIELAKQYKTIFFEDINGNNLVRGKIGSTLRQLTAPFLFRSVCKFIFESHNQEYKEVSAAYTSMKCNKCGFINEKCSDLTFECKGENCNELIHRDKNASKNILEKGLSKASQKSENDEGCENRNADESPGGARINNFKQLAEHFAGMENAKEDTMSEPLANRVVNS